MEAVDLEYLISHSSLVNLHVHSAVGRHAPYSHDREASGYSAVLLSLETVILFSPPSTDTVSQW